MLLLRTGESLDIKIDSFNISLKPLLSRHRIVKLLKSLSWLCRKRWSEIADSLHSTLFLVKCDIPMCSLDLALRWRSVLPWLVTLELLHENVYTEWDCNSLGIKSLKRKREERRFVGLIIILILHSGNEFLEQILNFHFKLDDNVPRYGSTTKSSFLGTVGITFFRSLF